MHARAFSLFLLLVPTVVAQTTSVNAPQGDRSAAARFDDLTPVALETAPGLYDIHVVAHPDGASSLALEDVALLDARLVGHARKDRLRLDRPRKASGVADSVRLPGGGALHLIRRQGATEVLLLRGDVQPRVLLSIAENGGGPAIDGELHVAPDGACALVCTTTSAGGNVFVLDLVGQAPAHDVTGNLAPLGVRSESLRVSAEGAFFVANQTLYRAVAGGSATSVNLPLLPEESVEQELVLASGGGHVAAVLEREDNERRIVVVPIVGPPQVVTPVPGPFAGAEYGERFAPFLALAADGARVAYRTTTSAQELFVTELATPSAPLHLTSIPEFPVYIDNVGVLAFAQPDQLCFFAGDLVISGVDADELLGAADMYVATFDGQGGVAYQNITRTNGQQWPPFTAAARLSVSDVFVDPEVARFLLVGEAEDESQDLSCFRIDGEGYHGEVLQVLLTGMEEDPTLIGCGEHVLVVEEPEDDEDEYPDALTEVHVLQPAVTYGLQVLTHLVDHPLGSRVERAAHDAQRIAYVVVDEGVETPHLVELADASVSALMPPGWSGVVAPALALSAGGQVVLGWSPTAGAFDWLRVLDPLVTRSLDLPPLPGFPLAH